MLGNSIDEAARTTHRLWQGRGARYDAASAPHEDLLLARRGTAFFARKLSQLSDEELDLQPRAENHTHAYLVAKIAFAARRQALILENLRATKPEQTHENLVQHFSDLDLAATLPPHALRHLFRHSEVHLNVCWRDLTDNQWDLPLGIRADPKMTPRSLPRLRAVQLWTHVLQLENGASGRDVPKELIDECKILNKSFDI